MKNAESICEFPLIEHRVEAPQPPGVWPRTRTITLQECPEPDCEANLTEHSQRLPCRWSWPYAHGRKFNGESFPKRKCPGCQHIRRAGKPEMLESA